MSRAPRPAPVRAIGAALSRVRGRQQALPVLVVLVIVCTVTVPVFASPTNLSQLLTQMSINALLVVGMTVLLIAGGVDLAMGSTVALSGVVFALVADQNIVVAAVLAIAAGGAVGLLNGVLVTILQIHFFIATLATMVAVRALTLTIALGQTIYSPAPGFTALGNGGVHLGEIHIGYPVIVGAVLTILAFLGLRWTQLGRDLYAIGGSPQASRLAGIPVARRFATAFVLAGLFAGVAGVILASRLSSASPIAAVDAALVAITASVLGGTSIYGGSGGIGGAMTGLVLISVIDNVMNILVVPAYMQYVLRGGILITIIIIDARSTRASIAASRTLRAAATAGATPEVPSSQPG